MRLSVSTLLSSTGDVAADFFAGGSGGSFLCSDDSLGAQIAEVGFIKGIGAIFTMFTLSKAALSLNSRRILVAVEAFRREV